MEELRCVWCGSALEENFSKYEDGTGYFSGYNCPTCHCSTPGYIGDAEETVRMKSRRVAALKAPYVNPFKKTEVKASEYEIQCENENCRIIPKEEFVARHKTPVYLETKSGRRTWQILLCDNFPFSISFKGENDQMHISDYENNWRVWDGCPTKRLRRSAPWDKPSLIFPYRMDIPEKDFFAFTDCWVETKEHHDIFKTKICRNKDGEIMILMDGFYWWTKDINWVAGRDYRCWNNKPSRQQMQNTAWTWRSEDDQ